jgi:hypothetical protein
MLGSAMHYCAILLLAILAVLVALLVLVFA